MAEAFKRLPEAKDRGGGGGIAEDTFAEVIDSRLPEVIAGKLGVGGIVAGEEEIVVIVERAGKGIAFKEGEAIEGVVLSYAEGINKRKRARLVGEGEV